MSAAFDNLLKAFEVQQETTKTEDYMAIFVIGVSVAVLVIAVEWLTPKKSLNALAGIFFGILVGALISWALSPVIEMINDVWNLGLAEATVKIAKWIMSICICYLAVSMVIQTKDDIRFVIPYVEFSRQTKGMRPLVLDTSVIIDGRIADIAETRLFTAPLVVPRFVLNELQVIADSPDKMKRNRGRRGLDILNRMQSSNAVDVQIDDTPPPGVDPKAEVDHKLVAFTKNCDGRLITNDYNLNKIAQLRGVDVININDLANAVKTVVLPGETMQVRIVKPGEEARQGIGYLDDGTMVVVEGGRDHISETVQLTVTSALQTSAGRMIFGKYAQTLAAARNGGGARNGPPARGGTRRS
ncbi:MAG TPA: TRAM domain-containing protein [Phycisphaerales bacterium]|nr:TRAM domain-containing protein [Phycisphaerales bacterium]